MIDLAFSPLRRIQTDSFFADPLCSHVQVPTTILLSDTIRIFFSSRDTKGESSIYFIDVAHDNPQKVLSQSRKAVISKGDVGFFDENGTMPSCVLEEHETYYLFYSGWSKRASSPYANFTGLAKSKDAKNFDKAALGPVLSQIINDPLSATSPCVIRHRNRYLMFYCSGVKWINVNGKLEHTYDIKLAVSADLINWAQSVKTIVPQKDDFDAITRPWIFNIAESSFIFYCRRSSKNFREGEGAYKIYYRHINLDSFKTGEETAVSFDFDYHSESFSKMQCYPCIQTVGSRHFLFFNGNSFGKNSLGFSEISLQK